MDGLDINQTSRLLATTWPGIREQLLAGKYRPSPVLRMTIPKPDGGERELGIPTVTDRLIQQALLQVLQPILDPTFSEQAFEHDVQQGDQALAVRMQNAEIACAPEALGQYMLQRIDRLRLQPFELQVLTVAFVIAFEICGGMCFHSDVTTFRMIQTLRRGTRPHSESTNRFGHQPGSRSCRVAASSNC